MHILLLSFLCFISILSFSQEDVEKKFIEFDKSIQYEIDDYKKELDTIINNDRLNRDKIIEYKLDLYRAELFEMMTIESKYATLDIVRAVFLTEQYYDRLLNKYYRKLLAILDDEDKEILRQAQRNWLQYRETEYKLNKTVSMEQYTGGGTLQYIVVAGRVLKLTKIRLEEIIAYLERIY